MEQYIVKRFEHPTFWDVLNQLPFKGQEEPIVLTLDGYGSFGYAPFSVLQCYNDFKDPQKAFHFTVPATPQAIKDIVFFAAPQVGTALRRIFVGLLWTEGEGILVECSYIPLLHKPMGLRIGSGANPPINRTFNTSKVVLKGDDAPIHMVSQSDKNPLLSVTITERVSGDQSVLAINLQVPNLATMTLNMGVSI